MSTSGPGSEATLESILSIISTLNDQVSSLSIGLKAVEGRVSRLEAATYTPATSPTLLSISTVNEMSARPVEHMPAELPASENIESFHRPKDGPPSQNDANPAAERTDGKDEALYNQPSDLKRQLQPINDGIDALTKHLFRIEDAIASSHAKTSSKSMPGPRSCEMCGWPERHSSSDRPSGASPTSPSPPASSTLPKPSKLRRSPEKPRNPNININVNGAAATIARPVFGQPSVPSTPGRRDLSLNTAGSPFTNYTDDQSPFAQLASRSTSNSSVLGCKPRFPPLGFQGLTQKSGSVFGTPLRVGPSLRGGD